MITLSDQNFDTYYSAWASIGASLSGTVRKNAVDVELLLCRSTTVGRSDSRILWALLTWIKEYSHLININRIYRFLHLSDTAVLGAVLEIAMEKGAEKNLKKVLKKCRRRKKPELLFPAARKIPEYYTQEISQADRRWKKWGLLSKQIEFETKAIKDAEFIFKNNKLLAIRSWIGSNVRSEILYFLMNNIHSYANAVSKEIGFSYPPVYFEIKKLVKNRLVHSERIGNALLISLTKDSRKILQAI